MRRLTVAHAIVVTGLAVALGEGCARGAPPTPAGVDATIAPLPGPALVLAAGDASPLGAAREAHDDAATTAPSTPSSHVHVASATVDAGDPGSEPQTKDKPAPSSPALEARAATLWDAIVRDDPDRAMPFFFPVTAYEQVKAIPSPASDWRRRLVAAYKRDVHALHKRLGDKAASAKLVRLDAPDERARWVEPNEESNKIGYWRVYGSRLIYEVDDNGKERSLDISSLISWRGEWYVVHLTGFK